MAGGRIKGITIELNGETKGLDKALQDVNKRSQEVNKELRDVERLLKFNPGNTELIAQKQKLLGDQVENTRDKLKQLKEAEKEVERQFKNGEIGEEQYRAFQRELIATEGRLRHFESQLEQTPTKMQKFSQGLTNASNKLKSAGEGMKNVGGSLTKGVTAPLAAAGVGLGAFVKKSAEAADAAAKNARKVGVSTEAYQEYQYALGQTGLDSANVDKALGRLNQRVGMATQGNKKYTSALKNAGVDMKALKAGTLSTDDAMMQAVQGLSKIKNEQDRAAAASELFGTKLGRELMPAIDAGAESLDNGRKKAKALGIVFSDDAAVKAEQFNDSMEDLQSGFKGAFQEMATKLIPVITDKLLPAIKDNVIPAVEKFGDKLSELITWFFNLSPQMQGVIAGVTAFAIALGPLLMALGHLSTGLATAIGSIVKIGGAFTKLMGIFKTVGAFFISNPILLAITAIAAAAYLIITNWEPISEFFSNLWTGIQTVAVNTWNSITEFFSNTWSMISETASQIFGSLADWFSQIWSKIGQTFNSAVSKIKEWVVGKFRDIVNGTKEKMNAAKSTISTIWNAIKSFFSNTLGKIWSTVVSKFSSIVSSIGSKMSAAKSKITSIWNSIKSFFSSTIGRILSIVGNIFGKVVSTIGSTMGNAYSTVKKILGKIKDFFGGINLFKSGKAIIQSAIDGLKAMKDKILKTVDNIVGAVRDFWPFSPAKRGPLSDIDKMDFAGPIETSLKKAKNPLLRSTDRLANEVQRSLSNMNGSIGLNGELSAGLAGASASGDTATILLAIEQLSKAVLNQPVEVAIPAIQTNMNINDRQFATAMNKPMTQAQHRQAYRDKRRLK